HESISFAVVFSYPPLHESGLPLGGIWPVSSHHNCRLGASFRYTPQGMNWIPIVVRVQYQNTGSFEIIRIIFYNSAITDTLNNIILR
ncbi:MAG: hypothetical protein CV089_23655, partial [Nitrospira sp. WS110]|nr:hypothetical protein [Nitrospira sp. WS110]